MTRMRAAIRTTEPTRYEVVLILPGDQAEIIGYTARVGSAGLIAYVGQHVDRILANVPEGTRIVKHGAGVRAALDIGAVCIKFTGRTEREAASEGATR